jgi:hypothetical protein
MHIFRAALLGLSCVLSAGTASAAIIGQQFTIGYDVPALGTPYASAAYAKQTFTAGPGVDTSVLIEGVTNLLVDLSAARVTVSFETTLGSPTWNTAAFNGIVLTAAAPTGIQHATVEGDTTLGGFDDSRVTWTGTEIRLNWNGLSYQNGSFLSVALDIAEPASAAVIVAGMLGLALALRRRRA